MNLPALKRAAERHAGHVIDWHDVAHRAWGLTSWGYDGDGSIISLIPALPCQARIIRGQHSEPLPVGMERVSFLEDR